MLHYRVLELNYALRNLCIAFRPALVAGLPAVQGTVIDQAQAHPSHCQQRIAMGPAECRMTGKQMHPELVCSEAALRSFHNQQE